MTLTSIGVERGRGGIQGKLRKTIELKCSQTKIYLSQTVTFAALIFSPFQNPAGWSLLWYQTLTDTLNTLSKQNKHFQTRIRTIEPTGSVKVIHPHPLSLTWVAQLQYQHFLYATEIICLIGIGI